jgi:hypothetical protein
MGSVPAKAQQTELAKVLDSDFTEFAKVWDAKKATQY